MKKWKIHHRQDVSPSEWFPVVKDKVELPNGKQVDYYKSILQNVAMILPIIKEGEVVFVRQYKHGVEEICIELPAGRIKTGKSVRQVAVDELLEETGISIGKESLEEIAEIWTEPSKSMVRVTCFLATNVEITEKQKLDVTENIEILKVPISELEKFIISGKIHASDTLGVLYLAKLKFPEIFKPTS